MKYIRESKKAKNDMLGIVLSCLYLFFTFLAYSELIPSIVNKGTLIAFLAYGAMAVFNKIVKGSFRFSSYSIWYGALIVYTLITFTFSEYPSEISSNHFYEMIVCFVITLLLANFVNTEKEFCWVCWSYVLSSFVMIVFLFATGKMVGNYNERLGNEAVGNANVFATFIMYSVLYATWMLIFQNYSSKIKTFLVASIILDFYALMLSAGRKFFVIPFLFLYILLLLRQRTTILKNAIKWTVFMIAIIFGFYLLIYQIPVLYNAIGIRIEQMINSVTGGGRVDESTIIRAQMRRAAINGWLERPLFGFGFNGFHNWRTMDLNMGGAHPYSHCNFTELLFNGGIVYFLFYYSFFVYSILGTLRNKENSSRCISFTVAAVISQIALDYGGVFYDVVTTQVFVMMAAHLPTITEKEAIPQNIESRHIYEKNYNLYRAYQKQSKGNRESDRCQSDKTKTNETCSGSSLFKNPIHTLHP